MKRLTSPEPPDSPLVDAAILVGGRGRRLGGTDKSALVVDGTTVLARELAALAGVAAHVVLVGDRPGATPPAGVRVVADAAPEVGPLGGIHTALAHATTDRTLILACDMPFLSPAFLAWLAGQGRETDVTVPRNTRGLHPLCAVWSVTAAPVVKRLLDQGVRKVGAALDALHVTIVEGAALAAFDPDGWLLHNINTPDDYARALARRG